MPPCCIRALRGAGPPSFRHRVIIPAISAAPTRTAAFHPVSTTRSYITQSAPDLQPFSPIESAILAAALDHVPEHGFSQTALTRGAVDAGYLPVTTNIFKNGSFDLVKYHLVNTRLALKDSPILRQESQQQQQPLSVTQKIRALLLHRLHANDTYAQHLPDMLAQMSLAGNIPKSLSELSHLVDEMWYLAGDRSVDNSWFTKRALLAGVYASSEVFMSQDKSLSFVETDKFVDRRLQDVRKLGYNVGSVTEWVGFTGIASVNVLRSWGVRI